MDSEYREYLSHIMNTLKIKITEIKPLYPKIKSLEDLLSHLEEHKEELIAKDRERPDFKFMHKFYEELEDQEAFTERRNFMSNNPMFVVLNVVWNALMLCEILSRPADGEVEIVEKISTLAVKTIVGVKRFLSKLDCDWITNEEKDQINSLIHGEEIVDV